MRLSETLVEVKGGDLGIQEMLVKLSEAVQIYQSIQDHIQNHKMNVCEMKLESDGSSSENHFDWESM